jgi:hypothetical protein
MHRPEPEAYVQDIHATAQEHPTMEKSPANLGQKNLGEGNSEAAAEFNEAEQKFVKSAQGREKIRRGAQVQPGEESALEQAEASAKARGKNDDSDTKGMKEKRR